MVNAALAIDRRVAVNLNYTLSSEVMNDCLAQCGIRHVLTSRRVMERFDLKLQAEVVYLEDYLSQITWGDKLRAVAAAWLAPVAWLERWLGLTKIRDDDLLTVIFTSGSTGRPKGVMLTHRNVGSNIEAVNQLVRLADDDVLLGILPLFHSFGYTDHHVDRVDAAAEGHLPFQPAGSPRSGQTVPQTRRHHHGDHADVRAIVPAAVRAGGFRHAGRGLRRGGKAHHRTGRRLRETLRRAAGGGLRRHGAFAGGRRQLSAQPCRQPSSARASKRAPSAGPCPVWP